MFKEFKQAKGYNINYHNHCIPKNAIYGRFTKNVYVYIDEYSQFKGTPKLVKMYIMDIRKESHFKPQLVKAANPIFKIASEYVKTHNLYNMKCEKVLCLKRSNIGPKDRTVGEYIYNARGRDRSQSDFMEGIKYREVTEAGYYAHERASVVASRISTDQTIEKHTKYCK